MSKIVNTKNPKNPNMAQKFVYLSIKEMQESEKFVKSLAKGIGKKISFSKTVRLAIQYVLNNKKDFGIFIMKKFKGGDTDETN